MPSRGPPGDTAPPRYPSGDSEPPPKRRRLSASTYSDSECDSLPSLHHQQQTDDQQKDNETNDQASSFKNMIDYILSSFPDACAPTRKHRLSCKCQGLMTPQKPPLLVSPGFLQLFQHVRIHRRNSLRGSTRENLSLPFSLQARRWRESLTPSSKGRLSK